MFRDFDYRCYMTDALDGCLKDSFKKAQNLFREKQGTYFYIDEETLIPHEIDGNYHILLRYPGYSIGKLIVDPNTNRVVKLYLNPPSVVCGENGPYKTSIIKYRSEWNGTDVDDIIRDIRSMIKKEVGN